MSGKTQSIKISDIGGTIQKVLQYPSGGRDDYHRHGNGPYHYASIGGNPVLEIYPLPKGIITADHTTRLGFIVENLNITIQNLRQKGIKIISEPALTEWGYTAIVQDFDGRKIELTGEKSK